MGTVIGNGRICWNCNERNYGDCLNTGGPNLGDPARHGASYCIGEEYFCYIQERRIIRHDGNGCAIFFNWYCTSYPSSRPRWPSPRGYVPS